MGAGKTRLVQAIAVASGADRREVVSPTFVLMQHYEGRQQIDHIDAYRIRNEAEFLDLGPDDYFEGDGLVLVEWADRVASCLPPERVEIDIEVTGPESRRMKISSSAPATTRRSSSCGSGWRVRRKAAGRGGREKDEREE